MQLSDQQRTEYNTVVMAALVHETGKFFQEDYGSIKSNLSQEKLAEFFIQGNPNLEKEWLGIIKWLNREEKDWFSFIQSHHYEELLDNCHEDLTSKKMIFAQMVCEADSLSGGKRNQDKEYIQRPILAMFNDINPGESNLQRDKIKKKNFYYSHKILSTDSVLPGENHGEGNGEVKEYKGHIKAFIRELQKVVERLPQPSLETLYYLLKKYLWCIPAPYYEDNIDISIFDHLKTTAAITAVFYKHFAWRLQGLTKEAITDRSEARYSLIQGDISGIQKFIYNISSKGASRGLKGRSFYLQLLSDAVSRYLLHELDLPIANLLYSSGGKFYILSHLQSDDAIKTFENHVNAFLYKTFNGLIYFAVGKYDFNGEELAGDFSKIWTQVSQETAKCKRNKFKHIMETDYQLVFSPQSGYGDIKFCTVCGKEEENMMEKDEIRKCRTCLKTEEIGAKLRDFNYLGETIGKNNNGDLKFQFGDFIISYSIYSQLPGNRQNNEMIYRINNTDFLPGRLPGDNMGFKFYGGNEAPKTAKGYIKTFDEIAKDSTGIERLGILRMDVDNLGYIFQRGIPKEQGNFSQVTGLSFYFDMFFQGYINEILKDVKNTVYVIYSGGDDLFIIGPWNTVVEKAINTRKEFSRFTAYNPYITLSAGIELISGKYPISRGAAMAGEAEERAKSFREEKNAVTFLDKTLSWKNFEICQEIKELIMEIAKENKGIINRLKQIYLLYQKNESRYTNIEIKTDEIREEIFYNKWMWRMVYSLYRFAKDNKKKEMEIENLKRYLAESVYKNNKAEEDAISFIDIPARWAEFLLRHEKKEEKDENSKR
jgi:CRISPR-associated protein Csm1